MNARPKRTMHKYNPPVTKRRPTRGASKVDEVTDDALIDSVSYDIVALRNIDKGSEILMSYGDDYWSHRPNILLVPCQKHQLYDTMSNSDD